MQVDALETSIEEVCVLLIIFLVLSLYLLTYSDVLFYLVKNCVELIRFDSHITIKFCII
jgi:hypothetical protein